MSGDPVVGLVMATLLEASPFIRDLGLKEQTSEPFRLYGDGRVALIVSGIGKANAAMACACLIQTRRPALVCNLGAAGAASGGCALGECYHISRVIEPDRPGLRSGLPHEHLPDVMDGFAIAVLATQDRPLREPAESEAVAAVAQLADMEGAAVVQACRRFGVRCYLFKFVSDTPGRRANSEIVKNIELYRDAHSRFFRDLVLPRLL